MNLQKNCLLGREFVYKPSTFNLCVCVAIYLLFCLQLRPCLSCKSLFFLSDFFVLSSLLLLVMCVCLRSLVYPPSFLHTHTISCVDRRRFFSPLSSCLRKYCYVSFFFSPLQTTCLSSSTVSTWTISLQRWPRLLFLILPDFAVCFRQFSKT